MHEKAYWGRRTSTWGGLLVLWGHMTHAAPTKVAVATASACARVCGSVGFYYSEVPKFSMLG